MISSQSHCLSRIVTLYLFFLFSLVLHTLASPRLHYCRHDQRDALLNFIHEFPVNQSYPIPFGTSFKIFPVDETDPNPYDASLDAWNKSSDCCSWNGVMCDTKSGQVISLDLSYAPLNNPLKPNSNLFKLQHLRYLRLYNCSLYGEIPSSIENLSRLKELDLGDNNLSGQVPASIRNLSHLTSLSLGGNNLIGQVLPSIRNLTQLEYLNLGRNNFSGNIPNSFSTLTKLSSFDISVNQFTCRNFSLILSNLTRLSSLYLGSNNFHSTLPPDMSRFHNLNEFYVGGNSFFGPFPTSLFMIASLLDVDLGGNQFKGPIEFGNSSLSSMLQSLKLFDNQFDGLIPESISQFRNLGELDLSGNSFIGRIPKSLSKLVNLYSLDLSSNKLEGEVPSCLGSLATMDLSHNAFSRFGKSWENLDDSKIQELKLSSNSFRGPFPHCICKLRLLSFLDLSNNSFSGSIPQCLRNSGDSLKALILRNNNFSGTLPDIFVNLEVLDVSHNQFEGQLPKSLINCSRMQILNVQSNRIKDKFPFWLGSLSLLHVLILGSNEFYGALYDPHLSIGFQRLRVIDVSHNNFTGTLPSFYFSNWREMTTQNVEEEMWYGPYMDGSMNSSTVYNNSMEIVNKGVEMEFERIRNDFRAIDFSGNRFYGKIPESIGLLKTLHLLNLSGNTFTGNIPRSTANLTNLEALDLSRNQLSGRIPQDLGNLSSLSTMDFSHNNLEGPIPQSTQFQSQSCSSFMDNPKLYGLEEICRKTRVPNPTPQESKEPSEPEEEVINWIAAAIAYGPGVFCGLVIGHIFVSLKHDWFMEKFGRKKPRVVTASAH